MEETIIKLIFKLASGKVVEIQTSRPFLISTVNEFEDFELSELDNVFRME